MNHTANHTSSDAVIQSVPVDSSALLPRSPRIPTESQKVPTRPPPPIPPRNNHSTTVDTLLHYQLGPYLSVLFAWLLCIMLEQDLNRCPIRILAY
jgi:hypothetical protein